MLTREEIIALIDHKIVQHEIRVAIISGIAGIIFLPFFTFITVFFYLRWL